MIGTNQSTPWNNIFYLQYPANPPTIGDLQSIATQVANAWNANIAPIINTSNALNRVECIDIATNTGADGAAVVTHVGTRSGALIPVQVACVFSFHVNVRYRGGHPRMYVPAGVAADVSAGRLWSGAAQTAFATAASGFVTAINAIQLGGSTFFMIMVSYHTAHALRPVPARFPIVGTAVDDRIDTQRRRLGKPV